MATIKQRLEALEQHVIKKIGAAPALVEVVCGLRTIEQLADYEKALVNDINVITIHIKDCRKDTRIEN